MIGATATVTEIQNNFDKYIDMVANGSEVIVTRDGREIGRFIPRDTAISYLTDALTGVLKNYLPVQFPPRPLGERGLGGEGPCAGQPLYPPTPFSPKGRKGRAPSPNRTARRSFSTS